MVEEMNIIAENYNALISIEEKVINLQKNISNIRTESYMTQNFLEKCFKEMGEIIVSIEDVFPFSSETKKSRRVGLDMPSHPGKIQATTIADKIRV